MRKNTAGFRETTRICPGCGEVRTYPVRQATCSYDCGIKIRSEKFRATQEASQRVAASEAKASPPAPLEREKEKHEVKGDQWTVSIDATRIKTIEQLIEHCQVDTRIWEVERFVANKWEVGAVLGKGRESITVEPLFQIKAWFKRRKNIAAALEEIQALKDEAKRAAPTFVPVVRKSLPSGNIAEIGTPDIHFGKLAWGKETGGEDYDVRLAVAAFNDAVASLLGRISCFTLDKILLVIGNDVLHVDNRANTTTSGTPQDVDTRYHRLFRIVRKLFAEKIEELRQIAPVRVIVVPGNHDEQSAWHLGDSLECWFEKCPDVVIDNDPTPRKYYRHGAVMLMWTHGDKAKREDYPLIMATEQPAMFGATRYREAHTGHLHKTKTDEFHGVRVRILPSLCAADNWHSQNGFVGNIRSAEAYVWNDVEGLLSIATYSVGKEVA